MKFKFTLLAFALFSFFLNIKGQLSIDAGKDTILCMCVDSLSLGGEPTAIGSNIPFQYQWKLLPYFLQDKQLFASDFLSDTTTSNPHFICNALLNDTLSFKLMVTDAVFNKRVDTVEVIISSIILGHLVGYMPIINQGDSVQLNPVNIINGIAPLSYHWEPAIGLSNQNIKLPYAKPDTTTSYICYVTDAIGCESRDVNDVIIIPTSLNTTQLAKYSSSVNPNPVKANSRLFISNESSENLNIQIINMSGKVISNDWFSGGYYEIGEKLKHKGIYSYIIRDNNKIISSGKLLKQ